VDLGTIPHIDCTLPTRATGTGEVLCPNLMTFDLHTIDSTLVCDDNPGAKVRGIEPQWTDTITYANSSELQLATVDPMMCSYTLQTNGGAVPVFNGNPVNRLLGMFSVALTKPSARRSLLLPIVVHLQSPTTACPNEPVLCSINGVDSSLQECIRAPVASGEIVLD
jgi:hypothetical protein